MVGNKIDIDDKRIISKEEGNKLADEFKMPYFETSAKKNLGVDDVFMSLIKEIDKLYKELHNEEIEDKNLNLSKKKKKRKKCC